MAEEKQRNVKTGVLEGMIDGIIMKTIWDSRTAEAEKDFSYFLGNVVAGAVQPGAYACVGIDLGRGKYKL